MGKRVLQANGDVKSGRTVDVKNVADSIVHMTNLHLDANVQLMTIMAMNTPFIGRGVVMFSSSLY